MKTLKLGLNHLKENEMLSTADDVIKTYPQAEEFLKELRGQCVITKNTDESRGEWYHVYLFTNNYKYSIGIVGDYCGCIMTCRKCEPMEDWNRGRDLPDGKNVKDTYDRIVRAIMLNELVYLGEPVDTREEERKCLGTGTLIPVEEMEHEEITETK